MKTRIAAVSIIAALALAGCSNQSAAEYVQQTDSTRWRNCPPKERPPKNRTTRMQHKSIRRLMMLWHRSKRRWKQEMLRLSER